MAAPPTQLDWALNVRCKENELGGSSFSILFFLGEVPPLPKDWIRSPTFVGSHHVYASGDPPFPGEDDVVEGVVDLNEALKKRLSRTPLTAGVVTRYLTQELKWRIQKGYGGPSSVPNSDLPSLQVVVFSFVLRYNPDLGIYLPDDQPPVEYPECTRGRDGM